MTTKDFSGFSSASLGSREIEIPGSSYLGALRRDSTKFISFGRPKSGASTGTTEFIELKRLDTRTRTRFVLAGTLPPGNEARVSAYGGNRDVKPITFRRDRRTGNPAPIDQADLPPMTQTGAPASMV